MWHTLLPKKINNCSKILITVIVMIYNSQVIRHNYLLCLICYASMTNEKLFGKSYCTLFFW